MCTFGRSSAGQGGELDLAFVKDEVENGVVGGKGIERFVGVDRRLISRRTAASKSLLPAAQSMRIMCRRGRNIGETVAVRLSEN